MAQKIREAEGILRVIPKPGEVMYVLSRAGESEDKKVLTGVGIQTPGRG